MDDRTRHPPGGNVPGAVGLFSADWGTLYTWANPVGTASVGSGPPPTFGTVGNAIVAPNLVSVGQTVRIDVPVSAGAAATGVLVDLELYNAAGTRVAQRVVVGQSYGRADADIPGRSAP